MRFLSVLVLMMLILTIRFQVLALDKNISPHEIVAEAQPEQGNEWQVNDTIKLMPGWVEWWHKEFTPQPWIGIEKGYTLEFHTREYLMSQSDVFFEIKEIMNWTVLVDEYLPAVEIYDWETFTAKIHDDPGWWLNWRVHLDYNRYGVSLNSTYVEAELQGDQVYITVTCHVTRVAEWLITWHIGAGGIFDLRSVSLGKFETYEYYIDYYQYLGQSFHSHFVAPSSILEESQETYAAALYIDPLKRGTPSIWSRNIVVMMPSATVIKEAEAESRGNVTGTIETKTVDRIDGNVAFFTIQKDELLPDFFSVESMAPAKTLFDILLTPGTLTGLLTAAITIPGVIKGVSLFRRHRRYNRLMRFIVKLYHDYGSNPDVLRKEMGNLTESIFTAFINDKLTDEQLEKLLHRRDDVLSRLTSGISTF